jgi:hypothetical protein
LNSYRLGIHSEASLSLSCKIIRKKGGARVSRKERKGMLAGVFGVRENELGPF